jgi:spermidine synthase
MIARQPAAGVRRPGGHQHWHHAPMLPAWITRLAAALRPARAPPDPSQARPLIRRSWRYVSLQFTRDEAQSRMLRARPDALVVDYTRSMLAALLVNPAPARIGMIGLGGGSQAKFCHRHLPTSRIDAIEINPQVIALRQRFRIPPDSDRFRVHLGDGAEFVRCHPAAFDLLLVDGYDPRGIPPALSTQAFYDDCRAALSEHGIAAFNLFCADASGHVERLRRSFGAALLVVEEPRMSNRVAFGWVGALDPHDHLGRYGRGGAPAALAAAARVELRREFDRFAAALRRHHGEVG